MLPFCTAHLQVIVIMRPYVLLLSSKNYFLKYLMHVCLLQAPLGDWKHVYWNVLGKLEKQFVFWLLWFTEYHFEICYQFFRLHPAPPQKKIENSGTSRIPVCVCVFFFEILFYDKAIYSVTHNPYIVTDTQLATCFSSSEPSSGQFLRYGHGAFSVCLMSLY